MKHRKYYLLGATLILAVLFYRLNSQENTADTTPVPISTFNKVSDHKLMATPEEAPLVVINNKTSPGAQKKIKGSKHNPKPTRKVTSVIDADPFEKHEKVAIPGTKLLKVKGLKAQYKKPQTSSGVKELNGFFFAPDEEGTNVFYDNERSLYAVWTGEILFHTNGRPASELLDGMDADIIRDENGMVLIRARDNFRLEYDLEKLSKNPNIKDLKLDIKYSRNSAQ